MPCIVVEFIIAAHVMASISRTMYSFGISSVAYLYLQQLWQYFSIYPASNPLRKPTVRTVHGSPTSQGMQSWKGPSLAKSVSAAVCCQGRCRQYQSYQSGVCLPDVELSLLSCLIMWHTVLSKQLGRHLENILTGVSGSAGVKIHLSTGDATLSHLATLAV